MRTVASTYLSAALETCISQGCAEADLLEVIPSGREALEDVLLRVPVQVYFDLLYKAEDLLGQTGIGLAVGQSFRPTTFLQFGYGLISCSTLREAMTFNRKYQSVNQQLGRAKLVIEGGSALVEWESEDDPEYARPAVETVLTGYVGIGKWITWTHGDEIKSMRFRHRKPDHSDLVEKVFECPVYYDQPKDCLEFDEALVDKAMPASNPSLVKQLSKRLDRVLLSMEDPGSLRLAVYRLIEQSLTTELPNSASIARKLGMSERTLRRRLNDEDQSFRAILAQVRQDVCEIHLSESSRTMVEISQLLGYSEHSAFIRAFRGWFGVTPTEYKRGMKI